MQLLVTGLAMGSIYGLVALGFVLLVNSVNIVNFAQGEFAMLGAFLMYSVVTGAGLPFWVALPVVLALGVGIGLVFERMAYRPLRREDLVTHLVATLAASVFLRNLAQQIWGPVPYSFAEPFGDRVWNVGGVVVLPQHVLILVVTAVLVGLLYLFFFRTRTGKMLRAASQDRQAAQLLGIPVTRLGALTFALAASLGALAGVLVAPVFFVNLDMGFVMGLKAFVASIIGGWGSVPGAIAGGLVVGVVEVFAATYLSSPYKDAFAFIILVLFLILLPRGIFGERVADKA